jgi:prevent-host-death family protein
VGPLRQASFAWPHYARIVVSSIQARLREVIAVDSVGIRELKTNLSRHLKRVRAGARLIVTEHGRSIATIAPVDGPDAGWVTQLIADGAAQWSGGKPTGAKDPVKLSGGWSASSMVLEDRR